jgi:pimeloyl-ACP methyl ester carboxylesterase
MAVGFLLVSFALLCVAFWERPVSFYRAYSELHMRLEGAQSRFATIDGYRVHYYALGLETGPVVVLVHGLGGRCEDWQNLAPYLVKAGFRVYMPDLLGHGHSARPGDFSYSVPDQAAMVVGFMNSLGLRQVDLGGWSMGGWIAQRIAADHPDRVRRLVLFDSAGINETPAWETRLFTPNNPDELDKFDALLFPHPPKLPGFVAADVLRITRRNEWIIHRAIHSMLLGKDATNELLPRLKLPVLIVWGAEDHIMPLSQGQEIHSLVPQSQLEVIPGCGHLAPLQCADQIGPKVAQFVKQ